MSKYLKNDRNTSFFKIIFVMCILFSSFMFGIIGNKATVSAEEQEQVIEYETIIKNFDYLCEIEKAYRINNRDSSPIEIVTHIENEILRLKNENDLVKTVSDDSSIGDNNYSIFGVSANSAEIALVVQYPAQAIIAFNASRDAVAKISCFYNSNEQHWLNNADAFRHAFWNALMEKRISKIYTVNTGTLENPNYVTMEIDFAKLFADAHEYGNTGVDSEMDLRNNAIGRNDGALFNSLNEDELAFQIMERISLGYYWKVVNYIEINGESSGDLVASDGVGLLPEIFDSVMFETTAVLTNKLTIDKFNWLISGEYIVPSTIAGKEVIGLNNTAFANQTQLTSVILPSSVTNIGESAFYNCSNLATITLSSGTSISDLAFHNCTSLSNIIGFNNVTHIGERAFLNCTSLQTITIPSTIVSIGDGAFAGCNGLSILSNSPNYVSEANVLYNYVANVKKDLITSGGSGLKVTIPSNVTKIGRYAFYNNANLQEVEILGATPIKSFAFANCSNLDKMTFYSETVPSIEIGAFDNSTFSLYVPSSVQGSYYEVFAGIANNIPVQAIEFDIELVCSITGNPIGYASAYYQEQVVMTHVPTITDYEFEGLYAQPNGQGTKYVSAYYNETAKKLQCVSTDATWTQITNGTLYVHWEKLDKYVSYDVVYINESTQSPRSVFIRSGEQTTITAPTIDGYTFDHWTIHNTNYTSASQSITVTLHRSYSTGNITIQNPDYPIQDAYFAVYYNKVQSSGGGSCVAQGTLITLADGSQVPVESLTGNERLLVWNLKTGRFDTAPILFIDSEPARVYNIINLYFSDGTHVKVIDEHAFWDFNLNKYVYLRSDASKYIGHYFNKQVFDENGVMTWTSVQLVNVTLTEEYTTAWSPVTYEHLCLYVNGMLSMPGGIEGLVNTYEVDATTMKIDQALYLQDVQTYGLFTYEEFYELYQVPREMFEAVDGANLKVAIGKGYIGYQTIAQLIERYSEFFV